MGNIKKNSNSSKCYKYMETLNHSHTAGRNIKWRTPQENSLAAPQNIEHGVTIPFLGIYPRKMKIIISEETYIWMFLAASFKIAKE